MAVGLAAEHEAAGGHHRAAATADAVWRLVLPGDLLVLESIAVNVPVITEPIGAAWVPPT